ncbi:MAG: LPS assembly lipoprotein LptE [candidate division WOR-3 bacterium]|jgi:hypothetical protein|nr:LPS assembly lipoprotein LptE [candidate division WOR-3 bacterium]
MRKILVFGALLLVGCCGYSTRALLPTYLKTIHILRVENRTLRPLLAENLNDELVTAFTRNGRLRVSSDASADLSLNVSITSYRRTAAVYDASRNVTQWRYELRFEGECRDQVKNTVLWDERKTASEVLDASMDEEEGIRKLLERAADEIVRSTLLAW